MKHCSSRGGPHSKITSPGIGWYALRFAILERDDFACRYCGQHAPNVMLEVDHVVARADGGTDDKSNLVTACMACNRGKEALRSYRKRRHPGPTPVRSALVDALCVALSDGPLSVNEMADGLYGESSRNQRETLRLTLKRHPCLFSLDGGKRWRVVQTESASGSEKCLAGVPGDLAS